MTSELSPEDNDAFAAEHALGLLTGDDLALARRLEATDAAFAHAVTDWETKLVALTDDLKEARPSPAVKRALMADLFPKPQPFLQRLWVWQAGAAFSLLP